MCTRKQSQHSLSPLHDKSFNVLSPLKLIYIQCDYSVDQLNNFIKHEMAVMNYDIKKF